MKAAGRGRPAGLRTRWSGALLGTALSGLPGGPGQGSAMAAPPSLPAAAADGPAQQAAIALGLAVPAPLPRPQLPAVPAASGGRMALQVDRRPAATVSPGLRLATAPAAEADAAPSAELRSLINDVARTYGHDAQLLHAIIHVESRFNPNAVSPKGAIGLMQVMPATAERVGVQEPQRTLFDPETNLHAGARYLRLLMDMFSDRPDLAVAAYNAGEGAVLRYQREVPPFRETQAYVRDVMSRYLKPRNGR
jgi:soluble lytic murein transglycosylase-like protein